MNDLELRQIIKEQISEMLSEGYSLVNVMGVLEANRDVLDEILFRLKRIRTKDIDKQELGFRVDAVIESITQLQNFIQDTEGKS